VYGYYRAKAGGLVIAEDQFLVTMLFHQFEDRQGEPPEETSGGQTCAADAPYRCIMA
jgi:hypothetical protein